MICGATSAGILTWTKDLLFFFQFKVISQLAEVP